MSLGFLLISCKDYTTVYKASEEINPMGWSWNDSALYEFIANDSLALYDIILTVNHGAEFGFENLYVNISTTFPDGGKMDDVVSLNLSDKYGDWLGDCGSKNCNTTIFLQENVRLKNGIYQLNISQNSRIELLKNIEKLSLEIRKKRKEQIK